MLTPSLYPEAIELSLSDGGKLFVLCTLCFPVVLVACVVFDAFFLLKKGIFWSVPREGKNLELHRDM